MQPSVRRPVGFPFRRRHGDGVEQRASCGAGTMTMSQAK